MKRSLQEVAELVVFGLIALLVGTGLLWLVGWVLSLGGLLLKSLAGLLWLLLRYIVPIAIVAGLVYFLVKAAQDRQPKAAAAGAGASGAGPGAVPAPAATVDVDETRLEPSVSTVASEPAAATAVADAVVDETEAAAEPLADEAVATEVDEAEAAAEPLADEVEPPSEVADTGEDDELSS